MGKVGQNIVEKENLQKNIERLAAQKEVYFLAKRLFFWQIVLTVIITVLLTLIGFALSIFDRNIDWLRGAYGCLVALLEVMLFLPLINDLKQKAAAIQELFDCDVLDIKWNKILVGDEPLTEDVKKYSEKHLQRVGSFEKLKDWYAVNLKEVEGSAAKTICQRSNFAYDHSIRQSFLFWVLGIATVSVISLVAVALLKNIGVRAFILTIALPFLPILLLAAKLSFEHRVSIKNLESLKGHITSLWSSILDGTAVDVEATLRQTQDKIYLNRKSSPLIPEKVYDWLRPRLEAQMYYSVESLVEEYKNNG